MNVTKQSPLFCDIQKQNTPSLSKNSLAHLAIQWLHQDDIKSLATVSALNTFHRCGRNKITYPPHKKFAQGSKNHAGDAAEPGTAMVMGAAPKAVEEQDFCCGKMRGSRVLIDIRHDAASNGGLEDMGEELAAVMSEVMGVVPKVNNVSEKLQLYT